MSTTQSTKHVPWVSVSNNGQAVSIEHPCIVKNIEKGIDMIGGSPGIAQILDDPTKILSLTFSPQDPAARTIPSNNKPANNILLRVSVPARTNRKRKRGSNDPFVEDSLADQSKRDGAYLLRSMSDNVGAYSVDAITTIQNMHMWRSMPDFVYSTLQIKAVQDVKDKLLTQHYPTIRDFDLPQSHGLQNTEAIPPPIWSMQSIPQTYTYRQNPAVKVTNDPSTGKRIVRNIQAAPKIFSYQVQWDTPDYPKVPMPDIPALETQSAVFQSIVEQLRILFNDRPLWTRRALLNQMNPATTSYNVVRFCIAYVAFAIRSGPWRDTYCRLGIDPRADPTCRFYQSIMLQLVPKLHASTVLTSQGKSVASTGPNQEDIVIAETNTNGAAGDAIRISTAPTQEERERLLETRQTFHRTWAMSKDRNSHLFDGVSPLATDGKVWQLCDITDPQLAALRDVHEIHIRAICDTRYFGWYENGTNAKIRVALKVKTDALVQGRRPDNESLADFLKLPEKIHFEGDSVQSITFEDSPDPARDASPEKANEAFEASEPFDHAAQNTVTKSAPSVLKAKPGMNLKKLFGTESPTKQQLEWASLYRAFARTEPGKAPAAGGSGKGRLSKTKLRLRKSYREPAKSKPTQNLQADSSAQPLADQSGQNNVIPDTVSRGDVPSDPIDIDDDMDVEEDEDGEEIDEFEEGPELAEGEEVLPSIEEFGLGDEDLGDEELDLDIDIKVEEGEEGGEVVGEQE